MSKGLEELKKARKPFDGSYLLNDEQYRVILNELQTLEIIKKKRIWVAYFLKCDSIEEYNHGLYDFGKNHLTPEEFALLKKVLL